ncbi:unnamed protein product [Effrenium voratum]|uniref:Uncharacterized protein n=1 Tax=Effrenium voratum TaxID=2562239 RepID=A0AA36IEW1_9DINO|nr:unnamed protein product [Effrenium voratum]CAJ1458901.1 unnamed protein product [Effrenium voratum]
MAVWPGETGSHLPLSMEEIQRSSRSGPENFSSGGMTLRCRSTSRALWRACQGGDLGAHGDGDHSVDKIINKLKEHFAPFTENALPKAFEKAVCGDSSVWRQQEEQGVLQPV